MRIWIDADAAPIAVKEIVFRAALRLKIPTTLVANQPMPLPRNNPHVNCVVVREGANVADRYIVMKSLAGEVAITADIPLAALLVEKAVFVIDPRGDEYHPDNIGSKLSSRNFMDDLRGAGMTTRGSRPYDELDKKAFASSLDRILTKALKQEQKP